MDKGQELLELKELIQEAKEKAAELKGKKKGILSTLKNKYKCNTIEEAREKATNLEHEIAELEEELETGLHKLKQKYNL